MRALNDRALTTAEDRGRLLVILAVGLACVVVWTGIIAYSAKALGAEYARTDDDRAQSERSTIAPAAARAPAAKNGVSLQGVVAPLAEKARAIAAACGSRVVSAVRRGATVYGGSASNHASGRAVDLQGNPACIYAQLRDWPGGVSTDYQRAPGGPHVHVSYNPSGMEWGLRFVHPRKKARAK